MTSLSDILIGLSYFLVSVAAAAVAFQTGSAGMAGSAIVGLLCFLSCGQVHLTLLRRRDQRAVDAELRALRKATHLLTEEVENSRSAVRRATVASEAKAQARNREIISEVRVIETLIGQLASSVKDKSMSRLDDAIAQVDRVLDEIAPDTQTLDDLRVRAEQFPELDAERVGETQESVFDQVSEDQLLHLIRGALDDNRVDVYIQPIVSLPQRKIRFYESFSYLRTEKGEIIPPNMYVRLAEDAGFISVIDNLLLFRCVQIVRRMAKLRPDVRLFCNISMHSVLDQNFFVQFTEFLSSNLDLKNHLIFELGQETLERCGPQEKSNMRRLSEMGFAYSLDKVAHLDLNLADLRERNFRYIKIGADVLMGAMPFDGDENLNIPDADYSDSRYVTEYEDDADIIDAEWEDGDVVADDDLGDDGLLSAEVEAEARAPRANVPTTQSHIHPADLKDLLDRYGMDLIVEKLESERQVVEVVDLDVDYGQGFLFGEPTSLDAELSSGASRGDDPSTASMRKAS